MRILFTTDGSPCSQHAMREAARLIPMSDAEIAVIGVADAAYNIGPYEMPTTATTAMLVAEEEQAVKLRVEEAVSFLASLGLRARPIERVGDPAGQILAEAHQFKPDVIVLGTHGRNALERFFLGSVSSTVAHRWPGAVLIVRPPAEG